MKELFRAFPAKFIAHKLTWDAEVNHQLAKLSLAMPENVRLAILPALPSPLSSDQQRRYYRGVVIKTICSHTKEIPAIQHERLKKMFFIESTTKLTTAQFAEFIEHIQAWAAVEYQIEIPDPAKSTGWEE